MEKILANLQFTFRHVPWHPQSSEHEEKACASGTAAILVALCSVILKCHLVTIKNRHTKVTPKATVARTNKILISPLKE